MDLEVVEQQLHAAWIAAEGTGLRAEDRKKALELAALLPEVGRALGAASRGRERVLVDAAAGKAYVGLLAAKLLLDPADLGTRIVVIERDARRAEACRAAAERLAVPQPVSIVEGDVADPGTWPVSAAVVVALHACGAASDAVIDRVIATHARRLLLVPCCVGSSDVADAAAEHLGVPRHAGVRRAFIESIVAAERTLRLEAAGWQTEVVDFVAKSVTPHNLLWRARYVGEAGRMRDASARLASLREPARGS